LTPTRKSHDIKAVEPVAASDSVTYNRVSKARVNAGPDQGSFRPNGSWDPHSPHRTPAYQLVQDLIHARQLGASPKDICTMVLASRFPSILGSSLDIWSRLDSTDHWPLAIQQSATSAAITVARFRAYSS
jgi:hypothetical protein